MTGQLGEQPGHAADPVRVLVVDDHPGVRTALAAWLADEDGMTVVGECEDGSQVMEAAIRLRPDVVVMDLSMPVMNGLAATEALRDGGLDTRVIMLTADGAAAREGAAAAGACAVVPKDGSPTGLLHCLRTVVTDGDGCPYCL